VYQAKKRDGEAEKCFAMAVEAFAACGATVYLKQAEEALALVK
jgi:hypothetical protein